MPRSSLGGRLGAVVGPCLHQLHALVDQVAAPVGGFHLVRQAVRQRAGFSPWRYLLTVAQSRIFSMRPRRRVAVSVLVSQIGPGTFKRAPTVQ